MASSSADPLADLQSRLQSLELSKAHADAGAVLNKERAEILLSLRKVMAAMKAEAAKGGGASSKELEELREENRELKKVNAKQQYRIEHLVSNLREQIEGKQ
ncbi:hypothetical protein ACHAXT_004728 [Thalassiosira profunda]